MATTKWAPLALLAALGCLCRADSGFVDRRTGVEVRFAADDRMFPPSWLSPQVRASARSLGPLETARSQRLIEAALAVYPSALLQRNLRRVYVVSDLSFYGLPYGGTNSTDAVFIANRGAHAGFTDDFVVATFHHELSSIFLRNYSSKFDDRAWRAMNAPEARYGHGGTSALREGTDDTEYRAKYNVDGFLSQYGKSSVEEDFNTYAEALFTGDRMFWVLVSRYQRISRKKDLAVRFFTSLDPQFDERFFRGLASK